MTLQDELASILQEIRAYRWTPELFQRVNNALYYTNVFRFLRANLQAAEYEQFDLEYCEHFRPGQKELAKYIKKEGEKEEWKKKKQDFLQKKRQLLSKKLQK